MTNAGCCARCARTECMHTERGHCILRNQRNFHRSALCPAAAMKTAEESNGKSYGIPFFILTNPGAFDKIARLTKSFGLRSAHSARSIDLREQNFIRRRIEVVITGRTRNAFAFRGTWVRIPPSPPDWGSVNRSLFSFEMSKTNGFRECYIIIFSGSANSLASNAIILCLSTSSNPFPQQVWFYSVALFFTIWT